MKALVILIGLLICPMIQAQDRFNNVIYLTLQPGDMGIGLRYDRDLSKRGDRYRQRSDSKFGIYSTISHGRYRFDDGREIRHHLKASAGCTVMLPEYTLKKYLSRASIGLAYDYYGGRNFEYSDSEYRTIYWPASFELGIQGSIRRFHYAIRGAPEKWQFYVDLGISF